MKHNFRQQAREALASAQLELDSGDTRRTKFAALELRLATEALIYDVAQAHRKEVPPESYEEWVPRKVLDLLLDIDPYADQDGKLRVGVEPAPGEKPETMLELGTEKRLSLRLLKKNYNALGFYLHTPTCKQLAEGKKWDEAKLRKRCVGLVTSLDEVLSSPVWNIRVGDFATFECLREGCGKQLRRFVPKSSATTEAKCHHCDAIYNVKRVGDGKAEWLANWQEFRCPTPGCTGKVFLWPDELSAGSKWTCEECEEAYVLAIGAVKQNQPGSNGRGRSCLLACLTWPMGLVRRLFRKGSRN